MRVLKKDELKLVSGGAITPVKENNGGHEPGGNAYGVPTYNENPAGKRPPGQN